MSLVPTGLAAAVIAIPAKSELQTMERMPLTLLFEKGQRFYDIRPDSAIMYYTAISNRYTPTMDNESRRLCLKAALERWELVFFNYFDYSAAFDCLAKAKAICADMHRDEPRIDLYYGCMYHTVFEQTGDKEAGDKAFRLFDSAFNRAINGTDTLACRIAYGNLVEVAHSLGRLGNIKDQSDCYRRISERAGWPGRDFDTGLYNALCLDADGDYRASAGLYARLVDEATRLGHPRYRYAAMTGLIGAHMKNRDFKQAIRLINEADTTFSADGLRDGRLILHRMKAECYDSLGLTESARQSMYDYVTLKDSLLNYTQAAAIKTGEFVDEIREFDRQLTENRRRRQWQTATIAVVAIVLAVVAVAWWKLRRKNKALQEANRNLYRKNRELLCQEEMTRQQRDARSSTALAGRRYKGHTVTDNMRETLWHRIVDILDHSAEIYGSEFSLDRLAELCDSKPKYVSQVINEKGDNFKSLLNTYRVHEACRNLTPGSNLTIEAVANNVGFRSVNAFRTSFKRVTGLSPSDYIRMARSDNSASEPHSA